MVRVNSGIYVRDLTDEHLIAENVELMMVVKFAERFPEGNIPTEFCLNEGHISFFRDKMEFLFSRLRDVQAEMMYRGINVVKTWRELARHVNIRKENYNNYAPLPNDGHIVSRRIINRIRKPLLKTTPYKYFKKDIDVEEFIKRYEKYELKGEFCKKFIY